MPSWSHLNKMFCPKRNVQMIPHISCRSLCVDALIELSDENADWKLSFDEFLNCLKPGFNPPEKSKSLSLLLLSAPAWRFRVHFHSFPRIVVVWGREGFFCSSTECSSGWSAPYAELGESSVGGTAFSSIIWSSFYTFKLIVY